MKDQRAHQGRRVSHASPFLFVLRQAPARGERAVTMVKKVRIVAAVAVALVLVMTGVFFFLPARADRQLNPVLVPPPYQVSERAQRLHRTLLVADLHADSLLWDRDLLVKNKRGQVDIPRLVDGNVALDTSGVGKVTEALIDAGFSDQEIRLIMGGNVLRVLAETLP